MQNLAEIRQQDIFTVDFSPASVVTMYLLPDVNLKLKPNLLSQLKPGSRIVSHSFDMGDWKPDKVERVDGRTIIFGPFRKSDANPTETFSNHILILPS